MCLRRCCRIVVLLIVALCATAPAFAQATSSLRGKVVDAQGAAIPGVALQLLNDQTGFKREGFSDDVGAYQFAQVPPGTYQLVAELSGFATATNRVTLQVNTPASLDVKMELASLAETVKVEAQVETINTVDATVGNAFNEIQVRQLPLLTRNVVELLSLQPGVTPTGEVVGARRDQNNITLDGVDVNDNQTAGLENSNGNAQIPGYNFNSSGNFRESGFNAALPVPLDSVQEFRVTVAGENANMGRSSGGQVTLVTKSGTNQFHGSAYEYNRDKAFSANSFFNNRAGIQREPLSRNQYGFSTGGPVLRNRLFFFGNVERRTDDSARSMLRKVPSDTFRDGVILAKASDGATYRLDAAAIRAIDPLHLGASAAILDLFSSLPVANDPASGLDRGANFSGYRFNAPLTLDNRAYVFKVDGKLDGASAHNLGVRGTFADNAEDKVLAQYPGSDPVSKLLNTSWGLSTTYTGVLSQNLVNVANFGLTRLDLRRSGTLGSGLTLDNVDVLSDFGNTSRPLNRLAPTYNFTDDLTWNKGSHSMTAGANVRLIRNVRTNYSNAFARYSFGRGSLSGLGADIVTATEAYLAQLTGNPGIRLTDGSSVSRAFGDVLGLITSGQMTYSYNLDGTPQAVGTPTERHFASNEFELYYGDNWRATPKLTITYGVRYVNFGVPYEQNGLQVAPTFALQDFWQERLDGMAKGIPQNQLPHNILTYDFVSNLEGRASWYNRDNDNFAPRAAATFSPQGEGVLGKLLGSEGVIRGGFGLTYDRFGSDLVTQFDNSASFGLSDVVNLGPSINFTTGPRYTGTLPTIPAAALHTFPFTPPEVNFIGGNYMGIDTRLHTPYSYTANLSVARPIVGGMTAEVGYIGRWSRDAMMQIDVGGWAINFKDPVSGLTWKQMAQTMRTYHDAGIDPRAVRLNPSLIPTNPFVENMFPGLKDLYFAGSASANYYDLLWNQMAGSDADAVHQLDRLRSARFPNCISATGCYTFYPTQSSGLEMWTNAGWGNFNGGTLSLRRPFRGGWSFDFNYTLSHSIDNGLAPESGGGSQGGTILNPYDLDAFVGDSDFDIRHNINANVLVELPFGSGKPFLGTAHGLLDQVVGGWQLSAISRYRSGLPTAVAYSGLWPTNFSFTTQGYAVGPYDDSVQVNQFGNPSIFASTTEAANWKPMLPGEVGTRAAVRLDDFFNTDLAITKNFHLPFANQRLQFRAEAFNVFNTVNFTNIALDASSPNSFGQFTESAPARVMQFALRYEF